MKRLLFFITFLGIILCGCSVSSENYPDNRDSQLNLPQKAKVLLDKGIKDIKSDRISDAISDLEKLTASYPDYAVGYYNLGHAYAKNNEIYKAIISWEKCVTLDKNYADAYYNLGLAYKLAQSNSKAADNFTIYLSLKPDDPNSNEIKAEIINLKNNYNEKTIINKILLSDKFDLVNNEIIDPVNSFKLDTKTIYSLIEVSSAPKNTKLSAAWYYINYDNQKIPVNSASIAVKSNASALISISKPKNGWLVGRYELDILTNDNIIAIIPFSIVR